MCVQNVIYCFELPLKQTKEFSRQDTWKNVEDKNDITKITDTACIAD